MAAEEEDEDVILFQRDPEEPERLGAPQSPTSCGDAASGTPKHSRGSAGFLSTEDLMQECLKVDCLEPFDSSSPPNLGPATLRFDMCLAARRCFGATPRSESDSLPPHFRRLMWMRWLGVLRASTPAEWLLEARSKRHEFRALVDEAHSRTISGEERFLELSHDLHLDVERCFPEVPRLCSKTARAALHQVLTAYSMKHWRKGQHPYRQGYHELAAAMLWVCWDGSWKGPRGDASPAKEAGGPDGGAGGADESASPLAAGKPEDSPRGDMEVYSELGGIESAAADAWALLEALLHGQYLVDMYLPGESQGARQAAESLAAIRCRRILLGLRRVAPKLEAEVAKWDLQPHVFLLQWVRLLFLREMAFPAGALAVWDVLFADAALCSAGEADGASACAIEAAKAVGLRCCAAIPLADFLALSMILTARPTSPADLIRFGERPQDVRRLLIKARELRDLAQATPHRSQGLQGASSSEPVSNAARAFALTRDADVGQGPRGGYRGPHRQGSGKVRYTLGDNLGGNALGHALGWAAASLKAAVQGVLSVADGAFDEDESPQKPHGSDGPAKTVDRRFATEESSHDPDATAARGRGHHHGDGTFWSEMFDATTDDSVPQSQRQPRRVPVQLPFPGARQVPAGPPQDRRVLPQDPRRYEVEGHQAPMFPGLLGPSAGSMAASHSFGAPDPTTFPHRPHSINANYQGAVDLKALSQMPQRHRLDYTSQMMPGQEQAPLSVAGRSSCLLVPTFPSSAVSSPGLGQARYPPELLSPAMGYSYPSRSTVSSPGPAQVAFPSEASYQPSSPPLPETQPVNTGEGLHDTTMMGSEPGEPSALDVFKALQELQAKLLSSSAGSEEDGAP